MVTFCGECGALQLWKPLRNSRRGQRILQDTGASQSRGRSHQCCGRILPGLISNCLDEPINPVEIAFSGIFLQVNYLLGTQAEVEPWAPLCSQLWAGLWASPLWAFPSLHILFPAKKSLLKHLELLLSLAPCAISSLVSIKPLCFHQRLSQGENCPGILCHPPAKGSPEQFPVIQGLLPSVLSPGNTRVLADERLGNSWLFKAKGKSLSQAQGPRGVALL